MTADGKDEPLGVSGSFLNGTSGGQWDSNQVNKNNIKWELRNDNTEVQNQGQTANTKWKCMTPVLITVNAASNQSDSSHLRKAWRHLNNLLSSLPVGN